MAKIKRLTDREHILQRTGMYLGSDELNTDEMYIFEDDKFIKKEVKFVPALIKIVNEIIDNSVDEALRTKFEFGNRIKIEMTDTYLQVQDNGRGIPVEKHDGEYQPKIAWGYARAGSNFEDDENRITIGTNGVGSYGANVMSKYFKGISQDGKQKIICEWSDNANPITYKEKVTKSSKRGVEVYLEPDFERLKVKGFSDNDLKIIYTRLVMLSLSYPEIKFYFNGNIIKLPKEINF